MIVAVMSFVFIYMCLSVGEYMHHMHAGGPGSSVGSPIARVGKLLVNCFKLNRFLEEQPVLLAIEPSFQRQVLCLESIMEIQGFGPTLFFFFFPINLLWGKGMPCMCHSVHVMRSKDNFLESVFFTTL